MASNISAIIAWSVSSLTLSLYIYIRIVYGNGRERTLSYFLWISGARERTGSWGSGTMKRKNGLASSKPSTSNLSAPSSPVAATPSPFATTARSPLHCFLQPSLFCFYVYCFRFTITYLNYLYCCCCYYYDWFCFCWVVVSCLRGGGTREGHSGTHQRLRLRTFRARLRRLTMLKLFR